MLWDGILATPPSFIHSIRITCKESGGSATRMVCPHISQTAHDTGSFLCLQMSEVLKTRLHAEPVGCLFIAILWFTGVSIKPACRARRFMVRVVFWGFQVLPCLVCHFEKSHKFCFVFFCFKQRNFRICGEAGENPASCKKKKEESIFWGHFQGNRSYRDLRQFLKLQF